ncbi:hypothetical protein SFRURICE_020059 [Spodoptera frugiperda]|nr:hypothetical protein SFRURICE_020059 [Spodoptera frugiperda]
MPRHRSCFVIATVRSQGAVPKDLPVVHPGYRLEEDQEGLALSSITQEAPAPKICKRSAATARTEPANRLSDSSIVDVTCVEGSEAEHDPTGLRQTIKEELRRVAAKKSQPARNEQMKSAETTIMTAVLLMEKNSTSSESQRDVTQPIPPLMYVSKLLVRCNVMPFILEVVGRGAHYGTNTLPNTVIEPETPGLAVKIATIRPMRQIITLHNKYTYMSTLILRSTSHNISTRPKQSRKFIY